MPYGRRTTLLAPAAAAAAGWAIAGAPTSAAAQPATPPAAPATPLAPTADHLVSYVEALPDAAETVLALLRAHAVFARTSPACLRFQLLRRVDRPHHFAILGQWQDGAAAAAHLAAPETDSLRAALAPRLLAPLDERPHFALDIGSGSLAAGAIHAVTHVDVVPPQREAAGIALQALVAASRGAPGNLGFDALVQASRPNHFTLAETWRDEAALLAHAAAAPTRAFRTTLAPMSGALFDERLYRAA
jgi:quinol monooxygenase YgiN